MYDRTDRILIKNYYKYLVPALMIGMGNALQQFVDAIIVARLIGENAISIEGYTTPLIQSVALACKFTAVGGTVLYAAAIGRMERDKAERIYSTSMWTALIVSLACMTLGFLNLDGLTRFLGRNHELAAGLRSYLVPTLVLIPVSLLTLTFSAFLTVRGFPRISSYVILGANLVNLALDFVYIKGFGMGIAGAQWATVSGYALAVAALLIWLRAKKVPIFPAGPPSVSALGKIAGKGSAPAISQLGLILYILYFNHLVTHLGGTAAMNAFVLCLQLLAVFAIFVTGISSTASTFVSILNSEEDYKGIWQVFRISVILQEGCAIVIVVLVRLFPGAFADLYNLREARELGIHAIRIYVFMLLFKGIALLARDYYNATGRSAWSSMVSVLEGCAGIILTGAVFSNLFGLDGVWLAFPVNSLLCCCLLLFLILREVDRKKGEMRPRKKGEMLLRENVSGCAAPEHEDRPAPAVDFTLPVKGSRGVDTRELSRRCLELTGDKKLVNEICLLCEEMYIATYSAAPGTEYMDIHIMYKGDRFVLLFRSIGPAFDPGCAAAHYGEENYKILNRLPDSIDYEQTIGMNMTKIEISCT